MSYLEPFKKDNKVGFEDSDRKVIIPPIYDCYKVQGNYILAGRDGFHPEGMTIYTGVYDLYTRYGDLIFGGINYFEETDSHYIFNLGGEWRRQCVTAAGDWPLMYEYVLDEANTMWLVLDKDLCSVKVGEDGQRVHFKKGFNVEVEKVKKNNKYVYYYNIDLELLVEEKPTLTQKYMLTSDPERCQAIRLSDGKATDYHDYIEYCHHDLFFIGDNGSLGISSFDNRVQYQGEYFAFTKPVRDQMFAFRFIGDNNCAVDFLDGMSSKFKSTVIASKPEKEIFHLIRRGYFRIAPIRGKYGPHSIGVKDPSIFDSGFASSIVQRKTDILYDDEEKYWLSNSYRLNPEYY